jgi:hypothetical protein
MMLLEFSFFQFNIKYVFIVVVDIVVDVGCVVVGGSCFERKRYFVSFLAGVTAADVVV